MPIEGGHPARHTFEGERATMVGWTPDGRVLYSTGHHSTLSNIQLGAIDLKTGQSALLPLSQANDGAYDVAGKTLFFTRLPFQGSHTKRYRGGTAQNLWKYVEGQAEATPLTADFPGTSKTPLWWKDRIYFVSDRDGTMNLWSRRPGTSACAIVRPSFCRMGSPFWLTSTKPENWNSARYRPTAWGKSKP